MACQMTAQSAKDREREQKKHADHGAFEVVCLVRARWEGDAREEVCPRRHVTQLPP